MSVVGSVAVRVVPSMQGFGQTVAQQAIPEAGKQGRIIGATMGKAMVAGLAVAGVAVAGFGVAALKEFAKFEKGMNEVFTLLPGISQDAMDSMNDDVRSFVREMGIAHDEAVPALYSAISAGIPQANVFDFMEVAAQAAIGGVTDMETSVDGLTSVMNAYGQENMSAQQAADLMFTAVRLGKTDFEQLSGSLYNVLPTASALGVGFEDITAAMASMTAAGTPTSVATTQMRQLLVELSKDGGAVATVFEDIAGKSFKQFIAEGGNTQEALALLHEYAQDTGVGINDLFGSVEAGNAALALSGDNAQGYAENIAEMGNAAGATEAAYEQMDQGIERTMERISIQMKDLAIEVGDQLAPALQWFADFLQDNLPGAIATVTSWIQGAVSALVTFGNWFSDNRRTITGFASVLGGLVAGIYAARTAIAVVTTVKALWAAQNAILLASTIALSTGIRGIGLAIRSIPVIGWVITLLGVLGGFFAWFFTQTETGQKIWETAWGGIKSAANAVVGWFQNTAWPILKSVIDAIGGVFTWLWQNVAKPVWGFMQAAFNVLVIAIQAAWRSVLKPVFDAIGSVISWLWKNVAQPIFGFIGAQFQTLGRTFQAVWVGVLRPLFRLLGDIIRWLWVNVARPYFQNVWERFQQVGRILKGVWDNVLSPMISTFGAAIRTLWNTYIRPNLNRISERWEWLSGKLSGFWNNGIKPVLDAFGNFVRYTIVDRVRRGVNMIKNAWNTVANAFRTPINWVINTVWNNGIKRAFDAVSKAVGSDDQLAEVPTIAAFGSIPGYAKGGVMGSGWKLVGEEGPELINTGPGWVARADQTKRLLADTDGNPTPEEKAAAAGDHSGQFGIGNWLSRGAKWVMNNTPVGAAVDWVRGGLVKAAEQFLKPILRRVSGFVSQYGLMGQLGSGLINNGVDKLLDWVRGEDNLVVDGEFVANPGGFNRPASGPITSPAGRRSYVGRFGNMHYGVDIGVPIGSAIRAAFDGVVKARSGSGLNQSVVVGHKGFDTAYMHNSAITSALGSVVKGGDVIARSGTAGSGPHLHFELHPGGYYNPSIAGVNSLFRDKGGLIYPGMNAVLNNTGGVEYVFNQAQFENLNRLAEQGGNGRNVTVNQYGIDYQHADRNAQAIKFTERRELRKAGVR